MKNECDLRGHGHPDEADPLGGHQTDNEDEAMIELEPHVILADWESLFSLCQEKSNDLQFQILLFVF